MGVREEIPEEYGCRRSISKLQRRETKAAKIKPSTISSLIAKEQQNLAVMGCIPREGIKQEEEREQKMITLFHFRVPGCQDEENYGVLVEEPKSWADCTVATIFQRQQLTITSETRLPGNYTK